MDKASSEFFSESNSYGVFVNIAHLPFLRTGDDVFYFSSKSGEIHRSLLLYSFEESFFNDDYDLENDISLGFSGLYVNFLNLTANRRSSVILCNTSEKSQGKNEMSYRIEDRQIVFMRADIK